MVSNVMVSRNSVILSVFFGVTLIGLTQAYYQGRHVCTERRMVEHPTAITQSYRKPVYKKELQKVVYVTAYRTVFKMEMKARLYRKCCQGWEKRLPRESGCIVPVCKEPCLNGGHCIAPDFCMCSEGYAGYRCQTDINECSGRHECQHKCINLPGTYKCACQKGFVLSEDETSCDLCLSCTPEFKALQERIGTLGNQVAGLENQKESLQKNLTLALGRYELALNKIEEIESNNALHMMTTTGSTVEHDYMMMDEKTQMMPRLASLSQQISILEERMADCQCNNGYY